MTSTKPILIFGYGNPSRGDDALGPALISRLEQRIAGNLDLQDELEVLTDFQLQVEHAMDLVDRDLVVFVDASVDLPAQFDYSVVEPDRDTSYTTHAMSPAAVLHVYERLTGTNPPPCYLLSIRGNDFGLGTPMSREASDSLDSACDFLLDTLQADHG